MKYYVWETNPKLEPISGRNWIFIGKSMKDVILHVTYKLGGGDLSLNKRSATLKNGNKIFATLIN